MAIEDIKQTHRDIASVMDDDYVFKNSNNGKIFNEFNKTGGDITKLEGYNILSETIKTLRRLLHGQKQAVYSEFSDTIKEAHELLLNNVEFFKNAFKENRDTVKLAYGTIASTLSLIVTNACSAILDRFEEHGTELDNTILVNKFKEITKLEIYKNLKEMIKIINNMELKKIVDKNIDKEIEKSVYTESITLAGVGISIGILTVTMFAIKAAVQFFYSFRTKLSDWLNIQADFLEMNIRTLDRKEVKAKQENYAKNLRGLASKVGLETSMANTKIEKLDTVQPTTTFSNSQNSFM